MDSSFNLNIFSSKKRLVHLEVTMKTNKLFQADAYMKKCTSKVIDLTFKNETALVILDQTVFFPVGGGQSCDIGKIEGLSVINVIEENGIIIHTLPIKGISENFPFTKGDSVLCELDWDRRFNNMQRHCGEHILSGMFFREYGGINRGFHMGEDYMTIDISLEENPEFTLIDFEMALKVEYYANEAIWKNVPVITRHFDTYEEAASLPLRKALSLKEDITIVCVGDTANPEDCVACCGTHPSTSGQVGIIKIFKVESYKGMFRIYFDAGKNALLDYDNKHNLFMRLGSKFSASIDDLENKMSIQEEKSKAPRTELHLLKQSIIKLRTDEIRKALANRQFDSAQKKSLQTNFNVSSYLQHNVSTANLTVFEYDDMKLDDLINIGRPLIPDLNTLLLIICTQENSLLLFSNGNSVDCGKLVKENASIYNGKGGGQNTNARVLFKSREYLDTFIDLINKHLS